MTIKRFNEEVGFDDEEMRDRLEIANLKGDLEPHSPNMRTFSLPTDKINSQTEVKKIVYREPILDKFFKDIKYIEGSRLISFFGTSKTPVDGTEFYGQLSFAYHDGQYYIGTILRNRLELDENKWVKHTFFFDTIEDTFKIADAFVKACERLGIIGGGDMTEYLPMKN